MRLWIFGCAHAHRYRELRGSILHLICESCGDAVPAVQRSASERASIATRTPTLKAKKVSPIRSTLRWKAK